MFDRFRGKFTIRFACALWVAAVLPLASCCALLNVFGTHTPDYDPINALFTLIFFGLVFSLFVIPIVLVLGVGMGHITSRGLVPRIQRLLSAADAWSVGKFQVSVQDDSADELGQLARQLNQMATRLQKLISVQQQVAILEERNRLAREFHDTVKQQLFATSMQLASARALVLPETPILEQCLVLAEHSLQDAQRALKETITALGPVELDQGDLLGAIQQFSARWTEQYLIEVQIQSDDISTLALPKDHAITLYRVIQEALANIARHSQATIVSLVLQRDGRAIRVTIADNGTGFDVGNLAGMGMGLRNIRERIEMLPGTIDIQSCPGHGTTLVARVALEGATHE